MSLSVTLSVCLSVCLSVSVCQFVCVLVCLPIHDFVVTLSFSIDIVYLWFHVSVNLSACLPEGSLSVFLLISHARNYCNTKIP